MAAPKSEIAFDRAKFERFRSKDYRISYMASRVRTSIAWQIRQLRESNGMSQSELAKRTGTRQSAVSRLENTEYGRARIQTLLDVATALDVALIVKFVSYDEFLYQHGSMEPSALSVETFSSTYEYYCNETVQQDIPSQLWEKICKRGDANSAPTLTTSPSQPQSIGNAVRYEKWSALNERRNWFAVNPDKAPPRRAPAYEEAVQSTRQERAA